jgi:hypothetical protein
MHEWELATVGANNSPSDVVKSDQCQIVYI